MEKQINVILDFAHEIRSKSIRVIADSEQNYHTFLISLEKKIKDFYRIITIEYITGET